MFKQYVIGLLAAVAIALAAPAAWAQAPQPDIPPYQQVPLHADREHAHGAADDARIQRLISGRAGGNVAVFVYKPPNGPVGAVAMESVPNFLDVPEGADKGHAERRIKRFLARAGVKPDWVTHVYSELEPCDLPFSRCRRVLTRKNFPKLERIYFSLEYTTPEERAQSVKALTDHNERLLKDYESAKRIMNPRGGRGGGGALPLNLARPGAPGGIDFSSLELRHVSDTGPGERRGLGYSFSATPSNAPSDPAVGRASAAQASDAFFTWLVLPPQTFWVNLMPDQPDRVIDPRLARTDAGRVLLEADLQLKRTTVSLINPDTQLGDRFWDELERLYGSRAHESCVSFRVWIVPAPATVRTSGGELYILDAPLDVDIESQVIRDPATGVGCPAEDASVETQKEELLGRLILPAVIQAVNTAPEYAALRRVYLSRVAAEWFRDRSRRRRTAVSDIVDSGDLARWRARPAWNPMDVFNRYLESVRNGEWTATRRLQVGDQIYERTLVYGGVDFSRTPRRNVSRRAFERQWPKLAAKVRRSRMQPTTAGADVWLGGADARVATVKRVRLAITASRRRARVGDLVGYRLRVSNPTGLALRGVSVCDRLPSAIGYVRASRPRRLRAGLHCFEVPRLPAGGSRTVRVTARVLNGASGRMVNRATASVRGSVRTASARATVQVRGGASQDRPGGVTG